jgi:hypothetical protein
MIFDRNHLRKGRVTHYVDSPPIAVDHRRQQTLVSVIQFSIAKDLYSVLICYKVCPESITHSDLSQGSDISRNGMFFSFNTRLSERWEWGIFQSI